MSVKFNLSKNEKALALNLAMTLECDVVSPKEVVDCFQKNLEFAQRVTHFWLNFNNTTRNAFNIVKIEVARRYYESVLKLQAEGYPEIEN